MISDYFRKVELRIRDAKVIADKNVDFREFSSLEGMLIGRLLFVDGSLLEFMEYLHKHGSSIGSISWIKKAKWFLDMMTRSPRNLNVSAS